MIEISDWVMHAHHDVLPPETLEYRKLRNSILSHFKEMGMEDCYTNEGDEYYETREYEENSEQMQFIEEYNEENFWEELVSRLVDRDYAQKYGNDVVGLETRFERITALEGIYADEVNEHGLDNFNFGISEKEVH